MIVLLVYLVVMAVEYDVQQQQQQHRQWHQQRQLVVISAKCSLAPLCIAQLLPHYLLATVHQRDPLRLHRTSRVGVFISPHFTSTDLISSALRWSVHRCV